MNQSAVFVKKAQQYEKNLPDFPGGLKIKPADIAAYIDHTLLKPDATPQQVETLCQEARTYQFASVCVNSGYVKLCHSLLADTLVKTCCTIGFPLGAMSTEGKVAETQQAVKDGAKEVDMVIAIGLLKSSDYEAVMQDIAQVAEAAHRCGAILKVILETGLLTYEEKIMGCVLSQGGGADFVKTSTGFGHGGATVEDIRLMRTIVGATSVMGVKASGGVRTLKDSLAMIDAGATRIGSSSGVKIMEEVTAETNG